MAPWQGPRHKSWASDTILSTIGMAVVFITYVTWGAVSHSEPPTGLTTLLGTAGALWFGAVTSDRRKRVEDRDESARQVSDRVDKLEHPEDDPPAEAGDKP